ncbi:protein Frey 1 isoform X1 [Erinaceus europaeus]|uniref:Protein Frey 1 isoform X1 n=1 Tax=Erinaceus europaeus TaxID=9365 RepID=A0ABM3W7G1_ERIEU|nr:protein Frey 1 isoform X1 [Erinaceus europaeus]
MVLTMLGVLYPRAGLSLFLLYLILAAALLRPQPLRSQRSVPEEFSAPLELTQPLSGLVDGSIIIITTPPPPPPPRAGTDPQGRHPGLAWGFSPQTLSPGCGLKTTFSSRPLPSSSSLDYGIRPKHPWPRGPRPLLSRAQQRKRDGPDMAEYYYDALV